MKRPANRNLLIIACAVLGVLLCLRAIDSIFIYPLAACLLAVFLIYPVGLCLPLLFFLMTSANIMKFSPGQISLYTVCYAVFVVRLLWEKKRLGREFAVCTLVFVIAAFVSSGFDQIITIVTMVFGLVMVNDSCRAGKYSYSAALYCFCAGICLSSLLGCFTEQLPHLAQFIEGDVLKTGDGQYAQRFAGLHGNPNYYTLDISVALACLGTDMCRKKPGFVSCVLFAVLSVFGLMSVSKSFLLTWLFILGVMFVWAVRSGRRSAVTMIVGMLGLALVIGLFAGRSIALYILRFDENTGSLSGITTGRTDIWGGYFREIFGSVKGFLLGNGLNSVISGGRPAHNTYVEGLYMLGAVGVGTYLTALRAAVTIPAAKRIGLMWLPAAVVLIRFLAAGIFTYDNTWFYYTLICLGWRNQPDCG